MGHPPEMECASVTLGLPDGKIFLMFSGLTWDFLRGDHLLLCRKAQLPPEVALLLSTNDPLESLLFLFESFSAEKENRPVLYLYLIDIR